MDSNMTKIKANTKEAVVTWTPSQRSDWTQITNNLPDIKILVSELIAFLSSVGINPVRHLRSGGSGPARVTGRTSLLANTTCPGFSKLVSSSVFNTCVVCKLAFVTHGFILEPLHFTHKYSQWPIQAQQEVVSLQICYF